MEELDRVGVRVTLAGCLGAMAGVGRALLRGHPLVRTCTLTAMSCGLTGTACFGAERVVSLSSRTYLLNQHHFSPLECTLFSHGVGGAMGGSLMGLLYIGKPLHGIVFFVPLMLVIGMGEQFLEDVRQERIQEHRCKQEEEQRQADRTQ